MTPRTIGRVDILGICAEILIDGSGCNIAMSAHIRSRTTGQRGNESSTIGAPTVDGGEILARLLCCLQT